MSPEEFMRNYWQKKPLLVRGAIPAFALAKAQGTPLDSPISTKELTLLSMTEEVESRLIQANPWRIEHGPLTKKKLPSMHQKNWTVLLQGMEAHHPAAATVLSWFRFIPDSRLDDLMISVASPGGGVGPHLDSYDVFLIQMSGRRHWKISQQKKRELLPNLPLKILADFKPEQDWILEPGDLLYLPPEVAHDGAALDPDTQTWSVGFRAPSFKELLQETLWNLAESLEDDPQLNRLFTDPWQTATPYPAQLPTRLIADLESLVNTLPLQAKTLRPLLENALGKTLSEPKPSVFFDAPYPMLDIDEFKKACNHHGLKASPKTRLLLTSKTMFCNGEAFLDKQKHPKIFEKWSKFAHRRLISAKECKEWLGKDPISLELAFEGYTCGWFELNQPLI